VRKTAQALLNALDSPDAELSILILDDEQIRALNRKYLNRPGATNVLAFPMKEGNFARITPELLGDVVISAETTAREASQMGIGMDERFNQLLIHGVLHLLGYDHEAGPEKAARMVQKSEALAAVIKKIEVKKP